MLQVMHVISDNSLAFIFKLVNRLVEYLAEYTYNYNEPGACVKGCKLYHT